jgi:hypothetical protein
MQAYDTQTDSWSTLASLPSLMSSGSAAATTGIHAPERIYVFGTFDAVHGEGFLYDPASDSWAASATLPESLDFFVVATVGDQLYVVGGFIPPVISGYPTQTLVYTPIGYGNTPLPTPEPSDGSTQIQILFIAATVAVAVIVIGVLIVILKRRK